MTLTLAGITIAVTTLPSPRSADTQILANYSPRLSSPKTHDLGAAPSLRVL